MNARFRLYDGLEFMGHYVDLTDLNVYNYFWCDKCQHYFIYTYGWKMLEGKFYKDAMSCNDTIIKDIIE